MTKIVVTGASGKAGRAVTAHFLAAGYEVVPTDTVPAPVDLGARLIRADLTDYGQAVEILHGADAVVHLANIPAPDIYTPATTFNANITMNSNIFLAAAQVGLQRVVYASSETTIGLPFDIPPRYAPIDEAHYPFPTSTYALSKVATETIAGHISQWSGMPFVGLRFSNILAPVDYDAVPTYWDNPHLRKWNLWGYVDVRDAAQACQRAVEADVPGAQSFIIAAADTIMTRPSADLMRDVFPSVRLTREVSGCETLLAIDAARKSLGYAPEHSWREFVAAP